MDLGSFFTQDMNKDTFADPCFQGNSTTTTLATGETFHYCCYVPQDGSLYELDGLKAWPINHGKIGSHWLEKAKSVISGRIEKAFQKDPGSGIYNL